MSDGFKQESERIGLHTYKVTQHDALQGSRALARLIKAGDVPQWSEADLDYFRELFADYTLVSGGQYGAGEVPLSKVFAMHFAGEYYEMMKWLALAIKVNFGRFFEMAAAEAAVKKAASPANA